MRSAWWSEALCQNYDLATNSLQTESFVQSGLSVTGCKAEDQTGHGVPQALIGNSVERGTIKLGKDILYLPLRNEHHALAYQRTCKSGEIEPPHFV